MNLNDRTKSPEEKMVEFQAYINQMQAFSNEIQQIRKRENGEIAELRAELAAERAKKARQSNSPRGQSATVYALNGPNQTDWNQNDQNHDDGHNDRRYGGGYNNRNIGGGHKDCSSGGYHRGNGGRGYLNPNYG